MKDSAFGIISSCAPVQSPNMSFKGITWAGNVYQKFETMCLEVEEAMYQDTVKYMENQVQKVGVSVKKFCSEVMDDMRPLSCIDPMSLASDDPSLIPYNDVNINKKPVQGVLDSSGDFKKKENENKVDVTGLFSPQSPGIVIENKSPEKFTASKKIGVQRRLIGIKRISKSTHPSKDSCRNTSKESLRASSRVASDSTCVTSSSGFEGRSESEVTVKGNAPNLDNQNEPPASYKILSKGVCEDASVTPSSGFEGMSASEETVKGNAPNLDNQKAACDDANVTSSLNILMHDTGESVEENTPLQDKPIESPSSESLRQIEDVSTNNVLDESVRLKGDPESASSCSDPHGESAGASMNAISSLRSTVGNLKYEKGVTASNEGTVLEDGLSNLDSTYCNAEPCSEDFTMSNQGSDSSDIEFVENDEICDSILKKFERIDGNDLEESCILVEGDDLHYPLQGTRKHKSYKKRIREALASKLRSRKDKQLVSQSQHKQDLSQQLKLSVESDWELL